MCQHNLCNSRSIILVNKVLRKMSLPSSTKKKKKLKVSGKHFIQSRLIMTLKGRNM